MNFNQIPPNVLVPLFYVELDNSEASFFQRFNRSLLVGCRLAAGTATPDVPILVTRPDQAIGYFGQGSQLERMVRAWFDNNGFSELWALPVNASGSAAGGFVNLTGTATASGEISLYVAGEEVSATGITVASGDTNVTVAAAINAAINANANLPVTAAATNGSVALTARHAGAFGNDIDVRLNYLGDLGGEATPSGLTVAISAMASGSGAPNLAAGIANMGDTEFEYIGQPFTDTSSLDVFKTLMRDATGGRWGWDKQLYGHVFSAKAGSVSTLVTLGTARNDQHASILGYHDSPTPPWAAVGMMVGQMHAALDEDPGRPVQTLPLLGFRAPPEKSRFLLSERNILLADGISTVNYGADGQARLDRAVTSYRTNAYGVADPSYRDVMTLATSAYVHRSLKQVLTQKFGRHKIADDGTRFGPGQAIVTPKAIKSELVAHYRTLEARGLVENADKFEEFLVVRRDSDDGGDPTRVNILYPPDYTNPLVVLAVRNQFKLQYAKQLDGA